MPDYSYSKSSKPGLTSSVENITSKKRKNTGCFGCLSGCFVVLFVVCGIFAGGFAYIYYMDKDEALGAVAVKVLKNRSINFSLLTDINNNQNIAFEDKIAIKVSYEKFLSDFDKMPKGTQKRIKKNFGVLIKKFIQNPAFLQQGPTPPELKELIQILVPNQTLFPKDENYEEMAWMTVIEEDKIEKELKKKKRKRRKRTR